MFHTTDSLRPPTCLYYAALSSHGPSSSLLTFHSIYHLVYLVPVLSAGRCIDEEKDIIPKGSSLSSGEDQCALKFEDTERSEELAINFD